MATNHGMSHFRATYYHTLFGSSTNVPALCLCSYFIELCITLMMSFALGRAVGSGAKHPSAKSLMLAGHCSGTLQAQKTIDTSSNWDVYVCSTLIFGMQLLQNAAEQGNALQVSGKQAV